MRIHHFITIWNLRRTEAEPTDRAERSKSLSVKHKVIIPRETSALPLSSEQAGPFRVAAGVVGTAKPITTNLLSAG